MPKEVVYGTNAFQSPDDVPIVPIVEVRWSKEAGDVQVVTRELSHEVPTADEQDEYAGKPWPCTYGFFVDLDRRAINDLIRDLRRARDQAFGRDE